MINGAPKVKSLTVDSDDVQSYLAVMIDLFSRRIVGFSMQLRMTTDLALQEFLSAVWRREPKTKVMIHSDQGSQFTSKE